MTEAFPGENSKAELTEIAAQALFGVELDNHVTETRAAMQAGNVTPTSLNDFFAARSAYGAALRLQRAWDAGPLSETGSASENP